MRVVAKNSHGTIHVMPGDTVNIIDARGGKSETLVTFEITEHQTFNTAFIAELEPGEGGFERGIIGGIAHE